MRGALHALLIVLALPGGAAAEVITISLSDALHAAASNSIVVKNSSLTAVQAESDAKTVRRSRLPEVDAKASYTRLELPSSSNIPVPGFSLPDSEAEAALTGTVPLYTGGRITAASAQAEAAAAAAGEIASLTRDDIILQAASAFLELLAAQHFLLIAEEALAASRKHLEDVSILLERGQVAKVDLFRSELDEAERERDLASAEANLTRRSEGLAAIIYPERHVALRAEWEVPEPVDLPSVEEWISRAEESSREVAAARLRLRIAEEGAAAARAEHRPTLGLFGSWGAQGEDFAYTAADRYWNAGLSLSFPLYRGGRIALAVERAVLEEEKARNGLAEARRLVRRGVVERHAALVLARRQFAAAMKAVRAAAENHRVTDLKYREGLVTNTDVIDALLSLSRARFDRVQSLRDFHINRFGLMKLAGAMEEML